MLNIVISLLTFVLILVSLFMVLVILMQRANTNSGMGSAFGGGVTESAFGAETTNILTKATKWSAFAFFIVSLVLYLMYMSQKQEMITGESDLPDIPVTSESSSEPIEIPISEESESNLAETTAETAAEAAPDIPVPEEPAPEDSANPAP